MRAWGTRASQRCTTLKDQRQRQAPWAAGLKLPGVGGRQSAVHLCGADTRHLLPENMPEPGRGVGVPSPQASPAPPAVKGAQRHLRPHTSARRYSVSLVNLLPWCFSLQFL